MKCPECFEEIGKKISCGCGWSKYSGRQADIPKHYQNPLCAWDTGHIICQMLGTQSAGGGDKATYYCAWHWRVLAGAPNTVAEFSEFVLQRKKSQPDSLWVRYTDIAWERVQGFAKPWPTPNPVRRDPDIDAHDPILAKRCIDLIMRRVDRKITATEYLDGLRDLDKDYPGLGFRNSIQDLKWDMNRSILPSQAYNLAENLRQPSQDIVLGGSSLQTAKTTLYGGLNGK